MKLVLQRVSSAAVAVDGKEISRIGKGFLILLGVGNQDDGSALDWLANKVKDLRIFPDENKKMNLSIQDVSGEILLVSQFTLYAKCERGRRPDFTSAGAPELAEKLYLEFGKALENMKIPVQYGEFGAMMEVSLCNDGPVTIILEK